MAEKAKKGKLRTKAKKAVTTGKAKKAVTTGKPLTEKDKEVQRLNTNVENLYENVTGIPKTPGEDRDPKDTRKFIDGVYKESYQIGQTTPKRFQEVMADDGHLSETDPVAKAIGNIKARKKIGSLGFRGAWN